MKKIIFLKTTIFLKVQESKHLDIEISKEENERKRIEY